MSDDDTSSSYFSSSSPPLPDALAWKNAVAHLSDNVRHLWSPGPNNIAVLDEMPSSLVFLRDYVCKSRPCIFRQQRRQQSRIGLDELVQQCGNLRITVNVTPDGHGDCVRTVQTIQEGKTRKMFVKPQEEEMTLSEFRRRLRAGRRKGRGRRNSEFDDNDENHSEKQQQQHPYERVFPLKNPEDKEQTAGATFSLKQETKGEEVLYYSLQNDCLRTELCDLWQSHLFCSSLVDLEFAQEAFGTGAPDAINLWVGDERAVSAAHKDHYENLFQVLSGEKIFTLCPPPDILHLPCRRFATGSFAWDSSRHEWTVMRDSDNYTQRIPWIEPDLDRALSLTKDDEAAFPGLARVHAFQVRVQEGDILYLPALWFHRVTQSCETVGLNYWYDFQFDSPAWCYFQFLHQMVMGREEEEEESDDDGDDEKEEEE